MDKQSILLQKVVTYDRKSFTTFAPGRRRQFKTRANFFADVKRTSLSRHGED
jgi:hypothetical protein